MSTINAPALLERMSQKQRNAVLYFCGILADKATRRILAYMEAKQCPISADAVPTESVGATRPEALMRLSILGRYGLVESGMVDNGTVSVRQYQITQYGTTWVRRCMGPELRSFQ